MTLTCTSIAQALDLADARHWTRQPPKRPATRLRHLLRTQETTALALRLFVRPDALTRWSQGDHSSLDPAQIPTLIEREIYRTWQTRIRHRAHQQILDRHGSVTVQLHARFRYTTPHSEFEDPRLRHLTEELPTAHAHALFEARHLDADEDRLRRILADGIGEAYFFRGLAPDQQQAAVTICDLHYIRLHY